MKEIRFPAKKAKFTKSEFPKTVKESTVCEQRDTSVPRIHHADYRDRDNWGTAKNRNIHRVVYSFKC